MVLIKAIVVSIMGRLVKRFRPLAGIMVLIGMILYAYCKEQLRFRPLAGIMVLIVIADLLALSLTEGRFRPLAGIMVLIGRQNLDNFIM